LFYSKGDHLLFVTNQHVVRDDVKNVIPDTLRLRLHEANDVSKSGDFDVPLYNGAQRLWKIHATHPEADIGTVYYLLGVYSATLGVPPGQREIPLGLGAAWYAPNLWSKLHPGFELTLRALSLGTSSWL
jgi:hypothetical protein